MTYEKFVTGKIFLVLTKKNNKKKTNPNTWHESTRESVVTNECEKIRVRNVYF